MSDYAVPINGRGAKGGLMVIVDHPNASRRNFTTHLFPNEQKLLDGILEKVGIKKYYITYAWPYNDEGLAIDGDKFNAEQVALARQWLEGEVELVSPQRILCLGSLGASALLGGKQSIKSIHGFSCKVFDIYTVFSYPPFMINKDPELFRDLGNEVQKLVRRSAPYKAPLISKIICKTPGQLGVALKLLQPFSAISCDTETTGLNIYSDEIETIGFAGFDFNQNKTIAVMVDAHIIKDPLVVECVRNFFHTFPGYFVFHNIKFDLQFISKCFGVDIFIPHFRDTMSLNYLRDERPVNSAAAPHGLKTICRIRYDIPDYHFDFDGPGGWWATEDSHRPWDAYYRYLSWDISFTIILYYDLLKEIAEERGDTFDDAMKLYDNLIVPGARALSILESHGALIDMEYFDRLHSKYDALLVEIIENCNKIASDICGKPMSINPGSSAQLGAILFGNLHLPATLTKKGNPSTAKDTLEELRSDLPLMSIPDTDKEMAAKFIDEILRYRTISKAQTTYVEGLVDKADGSGSVHTSYNDTGTATGRLSAEKPALQTIPNAAGPDIRRGFIAPPGYLFVKIDGSQLEYRTNAHITRDPSMIQVYKDGRDLHIEVASKALRIPPDQVNKHQRYLAKFIGFGLMYGRGADSIANGPELRERGISWTPKDAQAFIDEFLNEFPNVRAWRTYIQREVIESQALVTETGRIRRWPYIPNKQTAAEAQRSGLNFPIQSLASDITLNALIGMVEFLRKRKSHPILIVHDETDLMVHITEVVEVVPHCKEIFENSRPLGVNLHVPIVAEAELGLNWTDLYPWEDVTQSKLAILLKEAGRLPPEYEGLILEEDWSHYQAIKTIQEVFSTHTQEEREIVVA